VARAEGGAGGSSLTERAGERACLGPSSPAPIATRRYLMALRNIRGILGWGNLLVPCQAPLDRLRPVGEVCQLAWSSPFLSRPFQQEFPRKSRFLGRPRLLTRFQALPVGRDICSVSSSFMHPAVNLLTNRHLIP
jgi:hypothetical protein